MTGWDTAQGGDFLTSKEVAALLRMDPDTLRRWRREGKGPAWVKPGRRYLYPRDGVTAFVAPGHSSSTK